MTYQFAVIADVHESQAGEQSGKQQCRDGHTAAISALEDGGSRLIRSKTVKGSAGNVEIGVGGREDEDADTGVDDVRQNLDTSDLSSNDEGTGAGSGGGLVGKSEILGVVRNEHADKKDTEDVEKQDTVESELDGCGTD